MSQNSHSAAQDALNWANQKGEAVQKQIKEAVSSGSLTLIQSLPGHGARFDTFQALTTEEGPKPVEVVADELLIGSTATFLNRINDVQKQNAPLVLSGWSFLPPPAFDLVIQKAVEIHKTGQQVVLLSNTPDASLQDRLETAVNSVGILSAPQLKSIDHSQGLPPAIADRLKTHRVLGAAAEPEVTDANSVKKSTPSLG